MHFNLGPYRVPAAVADNLSHQSWRGEAVEAAGFQHHDALCIIKRALDNHGHDHGMSTTLRMCVHQQPPFVCPTGIANCGC